MTHPPDEVRSLHASLTRLPATASMIDRPQNDDRWRA